MDPRGKCKESALLLIQFRGKGDRCRVVDLEMEVFCSTRVQSGSELTVSEVQGFVEGWLGHRLQASQGEHWPEP